MPPATTARPPVTVVVPFKGDRADAESLLENLSLLRRRAGDQLIVADNTPVSLVPDGDAAADVEVVRVPAPASARRARNEGARRAANPWLLFLDADCRPDPELLDEYFARDPAERCGVIAGEVVGDDSQSETLARWARSRRGLMARFHVEGRRPAGIAGNLMMRREAMDEVGGFEEDARSEADVDLCWRVQDAGWTFEYRASATVAHRDPIRLADVWRQAWMYGAGKRWLRDRWGSAAEPPTVVRPLVRALGGALVWTLTARFERALFKLVDALVAAGGWLGYQAARLTEGRR
jgi:cellulose synthase/poly-beta-1,6-N-acetylglucosamine synthase-like glycosyltransferase